MRNRNAVGWMVACAFASVLVACGGGGGDSPSARDPLPSLIQDINPAGNRLDFRARNYFPMTPGDRWSYEQQRSGAATGQTLTRSISAGSGTDMVVTESMPSQGTVNLTYRRTADGVVVINPLSGEVPAAAAQVIGNVLEYPEPFYAVGATRQLIRQGNFGADLDDDGIVESFRLEISQVLVGFESVVLPSGTLDNVAHFRSITTVTIQPSDRRYESGQVTTYEDVWWAPDIGMVRAERSATDSSGGSQIEPYALVLKTATVNGQDPLAPKPDGTVQKIALRHNAMVFDRSRNIYYASVPASVIDHGNRIAMVDGSTGALSYSAAVVGSEPVALALSADGSALYVGLNGSGEVAKLGLPGLAEAWRVRLPASVFGGTLKAGRMAVSPLDADTIAVSTKDDASSGSNVSVLLVRAGTILPLQVQRMSQPANLIAFHPAGAYLYGLNNEHTGYGFKRMSVSADGLTEDLIVGSDSASYTTTTLDVTPDGLLAGRALYGLPGIEQIGQAALGLTDCRPAAAVHRVVCNQTDRNSMRVDATITVTDAPGLTVLARPIYQRGYVMGDLAEVVPGAAGQVALRWNESTSYHGEADAVWLFTSPMLP